MPAPNAFALMITSTLISVGIVSSIAQMGIVLLLFGTHGFIIELQPSGDQIFLYLSDTFALSPGLANAWLISIIPSVAVAAIIIHTSLTRDMKRINQLPGENMVLRLVNWVLWIGVWMTAWVTHVGLMMLVGYNIVKQRGLHTTGASIYLIGGWVLNTWVVFLDYGVHRRRWHPLIVFDTILICVAVISACMFFQGNLNLSVIGEWILLILLLVIHALLPIRGARIVLSPERPRRNACIGCMPL
jgi:hypothetical protein